MAFIKEARTTSGCVLCSLPAEGNDAKNMIVSRSKHSYIILNKYPYNSGHLMVTPLRHTAELSALSNDELLDLHQLIRDSVEVLKQTFHPQGFNIGINLGEAGGAGIREHLHYHVVPRWNGDTNYMPVTGETKVLPESLDETYQRIAPSFSKNLRKS